MAVTVEIMEKYHLILQSETFFNILDIYKRYLCIELSVLRCKACVFFAFAALCRMNFFKIHDLPVTKPLRNQGPVSR